MKSRNHFLNFLVQKDSQRILLTLTFAAFVCSGILFLAGLLEANEPAGQTKATQKKAAPAAQKKPAEPSTADILKIQILLDRANFSPGEIDGKEGKNTSRALAAFQASRNLKPTGSPDPQTLEALGFEQEVLTTHKITAEEVKGPFAEKIPSDLMEQSKLPALSYTSVLEGLAERYHVKPEILKQLNPQAKFVAGEEIRVPAVSHDLSAESKVNPVKGTAPKGQPASNDVKVIVRKESSDLIVVSPDNKHLFYAPVTTGSEHDPLPLGNWKVTAVAKNPVFNYNPELFWDADPTHAKAKIKPGPNNPVGLVWINLTAKHFGIHGTPEPGKIGYSESHGCIRLTNWDALKLASLIKEGTPVIFQE